MVVAGERHGNHENQRKHSEHCDAQRRQEHQQDMSLGVEQFVHIIHEARSLAVLFKQHLGLVCGTHRHDPQADEGHADHERRHAVEQDDHGTIRLDILPEAVNQFLAALVFAQAWQLGQITNAIGSHKYEERDFKGQHGNALDVLLAHDVSKTEYDRGKLGEHITVGQRSLGRVRRRGNIVSALLPAALHFPRGKSRCCHFDRLSRF